MNPQKIEGQDTGAADTALAGKAGVLAGANRAIGRPVSTVRLDEVKRKAFLALVDLAAINVGLWLALGWAGRIGSSWASLGQHLGRFTLLAALWLPLAATFDVYEVVRRGGVADSVAAGAKAGAVTLAALFVFSVIVPVRISPQIVAFGGGLGLAFMLAGRAVYIVVQPVLARRAVIVGTEREGQDLLRMLRDEARGLVHVVGFVDARDRQAGAVQDLPVLGRLRDLPVLIREHSVGTVVWGIEGRLDGDSQGVLADCVEAGLEVLFAPALYEGLTGRVPLESFAAPGSAAVLLNHTGKGAVFEAAKRIIDIVLASLGLIFLGMAFPFIALAIYLDCPGPIFYIQDRVGKGGRVFRAYKFRSMVPEAEPSGQAVWAQKADPRVTRIGRILRATHVDEFPQFLNILRGEMSAVGPRPERPAFVEELAREIPFYRVRHAVKPGMAGWGLVKQGYSASKKDAAVKLEYDLYYIKHQSLWLDLVILLKTFVDTFTLGGR